MALREEARGQGYGREALTLLTNWLFEQAGAEVVQAQTDPANVAMQTVCQRAGWTLTGPTVELGREWLTYEITRRDWAADALKPQR
jgi:RimJ/RimL family protein N-acetyltransferase